MKKDLDNKMLKMLVKKNSGAVPPQINETGHHNKYNLEE